MDDISCYNTSKYHDISKMNSFGILENFRTLQSTGIRKIWPRSLSLPALSWSSLLMGSLWVKNFSRRRRFSTRRSIFSTQKLYIILRYFMIKSLFKENRINKVVVVRHIGPNPNIPPPTSPFPVGRRPHYGLEVFRPC